MIKTNVYTNIELCVVECPTCGCLFGIQPNKYKALRENKTAFYCPSGHSQEFVRSRSDELEEQLKTSQEEVDAYRFSSDHIGKQIKNLERKLKKCQKSEENKPG